MDKANAANEDQEVELVRTEHAGQNMALEWGRQARGRVGKWLIVVAVALVIAFAAVMIAAATEDASLALANLVGFTGLGIGAVGSIVGGAGALRAHGGLKSQGRLTVTEKSVETSLRADPFAQQRARATDEFPHFRTHLDRTQLVAVHQQRRTNHGALKPKWTFDVLATTRTEAEYVLAVGCSEAEARTIVDELRAHLELPAERAADTEIESDAALAELHDAVTEYRKGPMILPEALERERD